MPAIGAGLTGGGIAGFTMGFALKKVTNLLKIIVLTLVGVQLFVLAVMESKGIISVDWGSVNSAFKTVLSEGASALFMAGETVAPVLSTLVSFLPATGGAVAGFMVGWQRG